MDETTLQEIDAKIARHEEALARLRSRREDLKDREAAALRACFREAEKVRNGMDEWMNGRRLSRPRAPFADAPVAMLLLGGCGGEWAARSRYRGRLPGFGGVYVRALNTHILIDPGRSTLVNLQAAGISPRDLERIIVTHNHWDCVRDLGLVINAASGSSEYGKPAEEHRLRLLAARSVLYGSPMNPEAVLAGDRWRSRFPDTEALREALRHFPLAEPPVLGFEDLFGQLHQNFETLEIRDEPYRLQEGADLYTRPSYHHEFFHETRIPALDLVVQGKDDKRARVIYLSDTEYRPHLWEPYARDLARLGPADVVVCNPKTLGVFPYEDGELKGYTRRHLGWKGAIRLTRDLQRAGVVTPRTLMVLRAWGIETVTKLDPTDHAMVATPENLELYETAFRRATGQEVIVPGRTWVGIEGRQDLPRVVFEIRPFRPRKGLQQFGQVYYRSQAMKEVVLEAMSLTDTPEVSVLIEGEMGTGKDELARAIHEEAVAKGYRSNRLLVVNSAQLPASLGVAVVGGVRRGAFTGAVRDTKGWLSMAECGTLILDEALEMSEQNQRLFLPCLQDRKFHGLMDDKPIQVTAQIIFTTNRDVQEAVDSGTFREDLFSRIRKTLRIPPLRERKEDILPILQGWQSKGEYPASVLEEKIIELLHEYPWYGNVRSLLQVFEDVRNSGDWSFENIRRRVQAENDRFRRRSEEVPHEPLNLEAESIEILKILDPLKAKGREEIRKQLTERLRQQDPGRKGRGLSPNAINTRLRKLRRRGFVLMQGSGPNTQYVKTAASPF